MRFQELLDRYPALRPYTAHIPEDLKSAFSYREYPAGRVLHQKDSPLDQIGFLCEGTLKVINEFDTGNAYVIEYDRAVDLIGDVAVLAGSTTASVTIEAYTPVSVLYFSRPDFERWLGEDYSLLREMARNVSRKLFNSSYYHGKELYYSSPRLMLEFLAQATRGADGPVRLPDTRQQLSEQLGMGLKTVDRTVARLKELGLVSTERGKLCVSPEQQALIRARLKEWIE